MHVSHLLIHLLLTAFLYAHLIIQPHDLLLQPISHSSHSRQLIFNKRMVIAQSLFKFDNLLTDIFYPQKSLISTSTGRFYYFVHEFPDFCFDAEIDGLICASEHFSQIHT